MEFAATQEMATLALALSEESARLLAVTITGFEEGTVAGARYIAVETLPELLLDMPVPVIVPTTEFPPRVPLTLHDTPSDEVPDDDTVAVREGAHVYFVGMGLTAHIAEGASVTIDGKGLTGALDTLTGVDFGVTVATSANV